MSCRICADILLRIFCICAHEGYCSVFLLYHLRFGHQGNAGGIQWFAKCSLWLCFLEETVQYSLCFFFKYLVEGAGESIWAWRFLSQKVWNFKFNFWNSHGLLNLPVFPLEWVRVVCGFCLLVCLFFAEIVHCIWIAEFMSGVCSNNPSSFPMLVIRVLSLSLWVSLDNYQFYWTSQRTRVWFHWCFSIVFEIFNVIDLYSSIIAHTHTLFLLVLGLFCSSFS